MAIKHPDPSKATAKQLYAHAFGCAYPKCCEPLFRLDPLTSLPHLNSRMCHIHARSEGGPRWDVNQSSTDNSNPENLVLMCEQHASMIDDPSSLAAYPAELLRDWKKKQLDDFKQLQTGWALGDDAAESVRKGQASSISISNSSFELGGKGGAAPGAGGGGGGAIGPGARGGKGGKGGNFFVDEGDFMLPWTGPNSRQEIVETISPPQWSGGGGGGAIGPNAIGGNGGNGGDEYQGCFDIEALNAAGWNGSIEYEIGDGGKGSRLPGEIPSAGGSVVLRFKHHNGTVLKDVKVNGGVPTGPEFPEGVRGISDADLDGGLQVTTLMAVNAAEISNNGYIHILGGDWRRYHLAQIPGDLVLLVFCSIQWRKLDLASKAVGFHLFLLDPNGKRLAHQPLIVKQDFPNSGGIKFLLQIGSSAELLGEYSLQIVSGQFALAESLILVSNPGIVGN